MEVLVVPADAGQPDAGEVVRKTASLPGERERLLREAEVLRAASERGVGGLAALVAPPSADAAEPCLVTSAVAGPSLAVAPPLPILEVAGVVAEVARLLAGLHDAGLVHGAVEPSHVVLDGTGGVILVGLGDGGPAGAPSLDPEAGVLDPAGDVAGWAMLVGHLLDRSAAGDEEPLVALRHELTARRARRVVRPAGPGRPGENERRVLAALADQALDADPARRPAARSIAAAVTHRVPGARIPGAVAITPASARPVSGLLDRLSAHVAPPAPPPADRAEAGSASQPLVAAGDATTRPARRRGSGGRKARPGSPTLLVPASRGKPAETVTPFDPVRSETSSERQSDRSPLPLVHASRRPGSSTRRHWALAGAVAATLLLGAPVAVDQLRTTEQTSPVAGASAPVAACPPVTPPAADVDGDGCEEAIRLTDGFLHAGVARFALGEPGAAWAVGDWDCDGRRTLALLEGGSLAVFDAWPDPGGELEGRRVAAAADATGLTAVPGPGGCDRPSLSRPGTADLVVDVGKGP